MIQYLTVGILTVSAVLLLSTHLINLKTKKILEK